MKDRIISFGLYTGDVLWLALLVLGAFAVRASEPDLASRYASFLGDIAIPKPDGIQAFPSKVGCYDKGAALRAGMLDGDYSGRPTSLQLAQELDQCDPEVRRKLAQEYEERHLGDIVSTATIALAGGVIGGDDYESLARQHATLIIDKSGPLQETQVSSGMVEWAAGRCWNDIQLSCIRNALSRFLPPSFRLDVSASLSLGDLFGAPMPNLSDQEARQEIARIVSLNLPLRREILALASPATAEELEKRRHRFFVFRLGPEQRL